MKITKVFGGAFASSVDPEKISVTLKGLIPLAVALLPVFGIINIGENDLVLLVDALVITVSAVVTLWGVIRKFQVKLGRYKEPDDKV